jgi:hypothetical protein
MADNLDSTIRKLRALGAPELLVRLALGEPAPGELRYEFQQPNTFWLAEVYPEGLPFEGNLVPLWETNGDSVTAVVEGKPLVIRFYYEDPTNVYEVVGHTIMEAIEHRLTFLLCETGADPADIINAARACQHPSPEAFVQKLQTRGS